MHMASQGKKYLPEDIVIYILYRVSVDSLVRCRCVCKTWYHTISSTAFIKAHLDHQKSSSNTYKYMLYTGLSGSTFTVYRDFGSPSDASKQYCKWYYYNTCNRESFSERYRMNIHGVCKGLLCLSNKDYHFQNDIYLWNPIIRKVKKLPPLEIIDILRDTRNESQSASNAFGLSFGYYNDDFKVVVICPIGNTYIVSVYSLESNSWKISRTSYGEYHRGYVYVVDTKFVNGNAYELICCQSSQFLVCFNLSNETIRVNKVRKKGVITEASGDTVVVKSKSPDPNKRYNCVESLFLLHETTKI